MMIYMKISLTLSKEEFEPMLRDLINKAMHRDVPLAEIVSVNLSYSPESGQMKVELQSPAKEA
jgi:hypothetical protein